MCIIITKERNAAPLPEQVFENAWDNNPDGAGILFNDGKATTLIKGIMKREDFLEKVKQANKKNNSFLVHTRIATHGSVKPENTHPFVSKTLGFAHNGTMNIKPLEDKTDSESFFLWTIADKTFDWCKKHKFLLDMATDGSRCVVFDMTTGKMLHLCKEDWKTDPKYKGCMFSNGSYDYSYYSKRNMTNYDRYGYLNYDWWKNDTKESEKEEKKKKILENVKSELLEIDKTKALVANQAWVEEFCSQYAEKSDTEAERKQMYEQIWALSQDVADRKLYDGLDDVATHAASIILSFYAKASHKGYKNIGQINDALREFIASISCETQEEIDLVVELAKQRQEWQ